jgi:predicted O-methyltransferase YrrM
MGKDMIPSFETLDELARGYQDSQILLTAVRLGVFSAIGKQSFSLVELTERLGTDVRATRILCDALVSLALLEKEGGRYENSSVSLAYLVDGSPTSKVGLLCHGALQYERWKGLYSAVRTGRPTPVEELGNDLGGKRKFARAMADAGRMSAADTAEALDFAGVASLLDIGGGPGVYAVEFARRHPKLRITILDDAETLEVAGENLRAEGLEDRIEMIPGDAFETDLGGPYDYVFMSNLVHIYSAEKNRELIRRCASGLRPSGRIALKDFVLNPDRDGPARAAIFAVNMLVSTDQGDCYTLAEIRSWLGDAGLDFEKYMPVNTQSSVVLGRKGI